MLFAVVVLLFAGAGAAAWGRGAGVIESRGVTGEPTREFRPPPHKARVAPPRPRASVDSVAASVRDSVALMIGQPPARQQPIQVQRSSTGSQEVTVPAPLQRRDPLARQIEQMLPTTPPVDSEPPPPPPPSASLNSVGAVADASAARAAARIDSATRKDVRPSFVRPR
jgi:hypothetical protein